MPQLQLPIFPAGAKCITNEIAVECREPLWLAARISACGRRSAELPVDHQSTDRHGCGATGGCRECVWSSAAYREAISEAVADSSRHPAGVRMILRDRASTALSV